MKSNKGITLVGLGITIIVLIIVMSITLNISNNIAGDMRVNDVKSNLLLIKAQVISVEEKHKFDSKNSLIGEKMPKDTTNELITKLISKGVISNNDLDSNEIYLLSQDDLNVWGLEDLDASEGYVVNYTSDEIIYCKGVKDPDTKSMLYKLSEMD